MIKIRIIRPLLISLFILVYIILSLDVMSVFLPTNFYGQNWGSHWEPGIGDVREPPLAYRILIPTISGAIQMLMPADVKDLIKPMLIGFRDNPFQRSWLGMHQAIPTLSDARIVDTFIHICVIYASLLAFIAMIYKLARALFPDTLSYALLAPLIALLPMVPITKMYAYYYDFSSMFFTCACLYLMLKRRWISYIVCLLVGIYNEETTFFLVVFYFLCFYKHLSRRDYILLGLLQLVLGLTEEGMIRYFTMHSFYQYGNSHDIWTDVRYGTPWWLGTVMFLRGHDLTDFFHTLFLGILVSYKWMEKPEFLRFAGWIPIVNIMLFFTVCNAGEYRDLYQSIPVLVLMATHTLVRMSGADTFEWLRPKGYSPSPPQIAS